MSFERDAFQGNALQPGGEPKLSVTAFQGTQSNAFQVGKGEAAAGGTFLPRAALITPRIAQAQFGGVSVAANLLLTTLAVAAAVPFFGSVQDNPQVRTPVQHEVGRTSLALTVAPFAQSDWQNPKVRPWVQFDEGRTSLALNNVPGVPFFQTDWPNPRKARGTGLTDFGPDLLSQLYYIYPYAPSDYQWPVPAGRKGLNSGFEASGLALTTPVVAGVPFVSPLPENPRVLRWGQTLDGQNALPLNVAPPAPDTSTLFRVPLVTRRADVVQPFQWTAQNLLPLLETPVTPVVPVATPFYSGGWESVREVFAAHDRRIAKATGDEEKDARREAELEIARLAKESDAAARLKEIRAGIQESALLFRDFYAQLLDLAIREALAQEAERLALEAARLEELARIEAEALALAQDDEDIFLLMASL